MMELVAMHIIPSTGRINIDFFLDGAVWNNPTWGSQAYVVNADTGTRYNVSHNPAYPYAYFTETNLPYGTYHLYLQSGTGIERHATFALNADNVWVSPQYYSLTYYANGGSGSPPASVVRLVGRAATVAGQGSLTRSGYTFSGWKTAAYSGTAYAAGSSIILDGTKKLYAQWTSNATPTIRVRLDGTAWSGCRYSMELHNVDTGKVEYLYYQSSNIYSTLSAIPCGTYDVYVASDGETKPKKTEVKLSLTTSNKTATIDYYTISFNGNGATSGTVPSSRIRAAGVPMPVPTAGNLKKTGYTFSFWTLPNNPHTPIMPNATYTVRGKTTLNARWYPGPYALGDVNGDGSIDTGDVRLVSRHCAEIELLTGDELLRADINSDGYVDTGDYRILMQIVAEISLLRIQQPGGDAQLSNLGIDLSGVTVDDLDWSRVDIDTIDWDTTTMEDLLLLLLGYSSGGEIM